MTDQIYYKIQYPIKKAIGILKKVDEDKPFAEEEDNFYARLKLENFLERWEEGGEEKLKDLIKTLREQQ